MEEASQLWSACPRDLSESLVEETAEGTTLMESTIGGCLLEAVRRHPERVALVDGVAAAELRRRWSYRELYEEVGPLAVALGRQFKRGDHVAIWSSNRPEWVFLQYAAALAGLVLVTVNPAYLERELEYVLRQSKSVGVFFEPVYRQRDLAAIVETVRVRLPALHTCVSLAELELFKSTAPQHHNDQLPDVRASDAAMMQYTSGTTGFPKGALLCHRSITNNARLAALCHAARDPTANTASQQQQQPVYVTAMPLFHTGGCVVVVLAVVQVFGALVLLREFIPGLTLELVAGERGTFFFGVPTMIIAMLEAQQQRARDLSSLRVVMSGGSVVPIEVVNRAKELFGAEFSIGYGQTETSPLITLGRLGDAAEDAAQTIGTPMPHTAVKIVDPDGGQVLPVGQVGEICCRGYLNMVGYYDMHEATRKTIDAAGWLHTGDLGLMDRRGYVYIKGRLKDMIIRGGENIYPREVEDVLYQHHAVADVAVVGVPDERYGEQVAAVVRLHDGHPVDVVALDAFSRQHLAAYKTPRLWFVVNEFPLTASGKVQKFVLVEMIVSQQIHPVTAPIRAKL